MTNLNEKDMLIKITKLLNNYSNRIKRLENRVELSGTDLSETDLCNQFPEPGFGMHIFNFYWDQVAARWCLKDPNNDAGLQGFFLKCDYVAGLWQLGLESVFGKSAAKFLRLEPAPANSFYFQAPEDNVLINSKSFDLVQPYTGTDPALTQPEDWILSAELDENEILQIYVYDNSNNQIDSKLVVIPTDNPKPWLRLEKIPST